MPLMLKAGRRGKSNKGERQTWVGRFSRADWVPNAVIPSNIYKDRWIEWHCGNGEYRQLM